ncbi:Galactose-binding domain-like, partial [Trinorchestia longiramus]
AATAVDVFSPNRVSQNLLDGVYDYVIDSCFFTENSQSPYVVFDLGAMMTVRNVALFAQSGASASRYFKNLEVKVGSSPAAGDFSSYKQLGHFPSEAPYENFQYNTEAMKAIHGRYVSVQ